MGEFKEPGPGGSSESSEVENLLETLRGSLAEIMGRANASRDEALRWLAENESSISSETGEEKLRALQQEAQDLANAMDGRAVFLFVMKRRLQSLAARTKESSPALDKMARQVAEALENLEDADSRLRADVLVKLDLLLD